MKTTNRSTKVLSLINIIMIITTVLSLWPTLFSIPNIFFSINNLSGFFQSLNTDNPLLTYSDFSIAPFIIASIFNIILSIVLLVYYCINFKKLQQSVTSNTKPYFFFVLHRSIIFILTLFGLFTIYSSPLNTVKFSKDLFLLYLKPYILSIILPTLFLIILYSTKNSQPKKITPQSNEKT